LHSDVLDSTGTSADLAIALPGDTNPIRLTGRVVRVVEGVTGPGMGIQLMDLANPIRRRLANFMIERSFQTRP
jgi:hypothetical protein